MSTITIPCGSQVMELLPCRSTKKKGTIYLCLIGFDEVVTTSSVSFCSPFIPCHGGRTTDLTGWRKHQKFSLQKQTKNQNLKKFRCLIFFVFSNDIFRDLSVFGLK